VDKIGCSRRALSTLSTRHFKRDGAKREGLAIKKVRSEYFHEQIYTTFFNDAVGGHILTWWGANNCMWSNDFPHGNPIWPNSRQVVDRDLGDLPAPLRAKLGARKHRAALQHAGAEFVSIVSREQRHIASRYRAESTPNTLSDERETLVTNWTKWNTENQ
jgi:hypothetical protein